MKSFRRCTNRLRQVPMSIISLCWYACCCCKPTCQGSGFHRSPSTADQSLRDDRLKRHFQQDRHYRLVSMTDSSLVKLGLLIMVTSKLCSLSWDSRQFCNDQGRAGCTVFIHESTQTLTHHAVVSTWQDIALGSWWNLGVYSLAK